MFTTLPESITTIPEAKAFLFELHSNGESYHPEDNAHSCTMPITETEGDHLNKLMEDIYNLPGNKGNYPNLVFDPCEYLINIDVVISVNGGEPENMNDFLEANSAQGVSALTHDEYAGIYDLEEGATCFIGTSEIKRIN